MSGLLQQKARCPHPHIERLEPSDPEKDDNQAQTGHSNGSVICSRGNLENGPNPGFRCLKLIDICLVRICF